MFREVAATQSAARIDDSNTSFRLRMPRVYRDKIGAIAIPPMNVLYFGTGPEDAKGRFQLS